MEGCPPCRRVGARGRGLARGTAFPCRGLPGDSRDVGKGAAQEWGQRDQEQPTRPSGAPAHPPAYEQRRGGYHSGSALPQNRPWLRMWPACQLPGARHRIYATPRRLKGGDIAAHLPGRARQRRLWRHRRGRRRSHRPAPFRPPPSQSAPRLDYTPVIRHRKCDWLTFRTRGMRNLDLRPCSKRSSDSGSCSSLA